MSRALNTTTGQLVDGDLCEILGQSFADWKTRGVTTINGWEINPTPERIAEVQTAVKSTPEKVAERLIAARQAKIDAIDSQTREIITAGIRVNGCVISSSQTAQINLYGMALKRIMGLPYVPQSISTIDGGTYTIEDEATLLRIAGLMDTLIRGTQEAGQVLRAAVLAATTIEEVESVKDER